MTAKTTKTPTETDLEVRLHPVLRQCFPWLGDGDIDHQTSFKLTVGRGEVKVDGRKTARSDIVLFTGNKPLAIVELKRPGIALKDADVAQGRSYAKLLDTIAPLVIVTNGAHTKIVETISGKPWKPKTLNEQAFQGLVDNMAEVATADVRQAVDHLMGTDAQVWMQAIRQVSAQTIDEMTSLEAGYAFVRDFSIPRKATLALIESLEKGERVVVVEGRPLAGKSNVLRELCTGTEDSLDFAVLFVEARTGSSIIRTVADCLADHLNWGVGEDEARQWLRRLSKNDGERLVLAIDGLDVSNSEARAELDELASGTFGPSLRLVVSADPWAATQLTSKRDGRALSAFGRKAVRVQVAKLDPAEFTAAQAELGRLGIQLMPGADSASEYRAPWILGMRYRMLAEELKARQDKSMAIGLPAMLSIELIEEVDREFSDVETRLLFQSLARAVFEDSEDVAQPPELLLELGTTYLTRSETLNKFAPETHLKELEQRGYLRLARARSGEFIYYAHFPELIASELVKVVAENVMEKARTLSVGAALATLSRTGMHLPFGDVVAAAALIEVAKRDGELAASVVSELCNMPPRPEDMPPGRVMQMLYPDVGLTTLTVLEGGKLLAEANSRSVIIDAEEEGMPQTYADFAPWLILSHFATYPLVGKNGNGEMERLDQRLLLLLGASTVILRNADGVSDPEGLASHDIPGVGAVLCDHGRFVEVVTCTLFRHLMREEPTSAAAFITRAVAKQSIPLLGRLRTVLHYIAEQVSDPARQPLASKALKEQVEPEFEGLLKETFDRLRR